MDKVLKELVVSERIVTGRQPKTKMVIIVLCNGGYTCENFVHAVIALISAEVEVAKQNELHEFAVITKRWVVESTFDQLEIFRCLWKNFKRKIHISLQMTGCVFITLLLKSY